MNILKLKDIEFKYGDIPRPKSTLTKNLVIILPTHDLKIYLLNKAHTKLSSVSELADGLSKNGSIYQLTIRRYDQAYERKVKLAFDVLLTESKPLFSFASTLYYPFDLDGHDHLMGNTIKESSVPNLNRKFAFYLDQSDKNIENDEFSLEQRSQTYLYFKPRVQEKLFSFTDDKSKESKIAEYRLPLSYLANNKVQVVNDDESKPGATAKLTNVSLHQHPVSTGSFLLSVQLESLIEIDDEELNETHNVQSLWAYHSINDDNWCDKLLAAVRDNNLKLLKLFSDMQCYKWLELSFFFRILHPRYPEEIAEGKLTYCTLNINGDSVHSFESMHLDDIEASFKTNSKLEKFFPSTANKEYQQGEDKFFNQIVTYLASQFFEEPSKAQSLLNQACHTRQDSRMYSLISSNFLGRYPECEVAKTNFDKYFSLFRFVDKYNDTFDTYQGYAYNPAFLKNLEKEQEYTRWDNMSYKAANNEFATVFCGFGCFSGTKVLSDIQNRYHYFLVYSLLTKEVLHCFARAIEKSSLQLIDDNYNTAPKAECFREIRACQIKLINSYWFQQLSSEQQGLELYAKIKDQLNLEKEYQFINEKIHIADEYMESKRNNYYVEKTDLASNTALIIAIFAICISYPNFLSIKPIVSLFNHYLNNIWFTELVVRLGSATLSAIAIIGIYKVCKKIGLKKKNNN